jgi:hypothetical protein
MSTTLDYLQNKYGPLMSINALAETFDRSKEGLRVSLCSDSDFSKAVNAAKTKCGRRVYFRSGQIAEIIDGEAL